MHERERWQLILTQVRSRGVMRLRELAAMTGASPATLRRDVTKLEEMGQIRRIHGGIEVVEANQQSHLTARPFDVAQNLNTAKKRALAREAANLCIDGESIIINAGSTTFFMAEYLRERRLQILTNSFPIAQELIGTSGNRIVLPGVGAFDRAVQNLRSRGLMDLLHDQVEKEAKPILGICLGMQLLAESSSEGGDNSGLGLLPGKVLRLQPTNGERVPHMGWNELRLNGEHPLFKGVVRGTDFYFVHSYYAEPRDSACMLETAVSGRFRGLFRVAARRSCVYAFETESDGPGFRGASRFPLFRG